MKSLIVTEPDCCARATENPADVASMAAAQIEVRNALENMVNFIKRPTGFR
jgi:hypothetical protein